MSPPRLTLDPSVRRASRALEERKVPAPRALLLPATGIALLPEYLDASMEVPLDGIEGVPAPWRESTLWAGRLGATPTWILEDVSGDPLDEEPERAWVRGFPLWLAATCGASLCVHTSAGSALLHGLKAWALYPPATAPAAHAIRLAGYRGGRYDPAAPAE